MAREPLANARLAGLRFPPIITGRPLEIRLPMGIGVPPGTLPPGKQQKRAKPAPPTRGAVTVS